MEKTYISLQTSLIITILVGIFFIGLSIGILSKGPIALILSIPPLLAWILRFKINPKLILKTDLIFGFLLLLLLSSPWYYLNEKYSPGFINYFIIGEHFQRFLDLLD